jgi:hypothetical protein
MTSKQLTLIQPEDHFGSALKEIEQTEKMCGMLMKTAHYQKMGQEGIFAIVSKAKSLGINPLEALNGGLYFVQGKVGMSSEMMACLIRQAGHSITKDAKSNNSQVILHGKRADNGDTWTIVFSMEDAKRAGIAKMMYDKYPGVMLYNRAMSMLARQLFPDVIKGAGYTHDELREIARGKDEAPRFETKPEELQMSDAKVEEEKLISSEQYDELAALLEKCSPDCQQAINDWLVSKQMNSLQNLPLKMYESVKGKLTKNSVEYQQSVTLIEEIAVEA